MYLIIASAMEAFVSISEAMAQALFSSGWGVAGSVGQVATSASQSILSAVGLDNKTQGMIQNIKQQMSKDRPKVEVKDNSISPKSETPKQSDKQESSDKETGNNSGSPKTPEQSREGSKKSGPKAKNKEENGEE